MGRAELVASLAIPAGRLSNTTDAAFAIPAGPLARTAGLGGHCPILDVLSTTCMQTGLARSLLRRLRGGGLRVGPT